MLLSCHESVADEQTTVKDAYITETSAADTSIPFNDTVKPFRGGGKIDTKGLHSAELLDFARTQIGVPYLYASIDPAKGFDCSGFITYVFHHFNVEVPRSSVDFTNIETEVPLQSTTPGDLILFTGTDSAATEVGHMGIIIDHSDSIRFIHSTSGRANGVTITALNSYYMKRFVKVIKIFND
jgi:cell wall-associated NlpC family hydrolase